VAVSESTAVAVASPNIALIKYWGNRDDALRVPANGSISLTLGGLETVTEVIFQSRRRKDSLTINGRPATPEARDRVSRHLDGIRAMAGLASGARVRSRSNFPPSAGIASSAAAFAALTVAAAHAAGLQLDPKVISTLARRGSGSACRSIFGGFVEWQAGSGDADSFAAPLLPGDYWPLVDLLAIVSRKPKATGSTRGHALAASSPIQAARLADTPRRLSECRAALNGRDFDRLAAIVELDSNLMHAVMLTSQPPQLYWLPETVRVMHAAAEWRRAGLEVCTTVDAGPNVHCLCAPAAAAGVARRLRGLPGVLAVVRCPPGREARLVPSFKGSSKPR
jgi:diphosphomevalonate decarboxylase